MPATYQKKYYYQFTSLDGKVNLVELWQYTALTPTAEEVEGMGMPFSIELPGLDSKFQVVRGTGCEINMLSATDRKFFTGLYHTQMKEFMIKHYIDTVINWLGYLNAEMVRESYSEFTNYPFQITGNDGFALLDRHQFLDGSGNKYSGTASLFALINIALTKIGLPFASIHICLQTTFADQTADADSTLLHEVFVDCANFYNEDGVAETMRKVIEGCLAPFAAFITQIGGDIYIMDSETLATGGGTFKTFTQSSGAYVESNVIDLFKDVSDIGYMGTGSDIEMSGGKNKQVVSYSPYPLKIILPESLFDLSEVTGAIPGTFTQKEYASAGNNLMYKSLVNHIVFDTYSPALLELSYHAQDEVEQDACVNVFMKGDNGASRKIIDLKVDPYLTVTGNIDKSLSYTKSNRGVKLKLSGEVYLEFGTTSADGHGMAEISLKTLIKIGGVSVSDGTPTFLDSQGVTPTWVTYPGSPQKYHYINIKLKGGEDIKNKWVPFEWEGEPHYIPVPSIVGGYMSVEIYSDYEFRKFTGYAPTVGSNYWGNAIRLRKIAVTVVDTDTLEDVGDNDVEFVGYLDTAVKEEADKVELICGTDTTCVDRGKLMWFADTSASEYAPITTFTRGGQTYRIEGLLLNSLSSNYRFGYLTISNLKLKNGFNQLTAITDEDIIADKVFMPTAMKINFRDDLIETTMTEITVDSLTIA